jgi:hypothetical protein
MHGSHQVAVEAVTVSSHGHSKVHLAIGIVGLCLAQVPVNATGTQQGATATPVPSLHGTQTNVHTLSLLALPPIYCAQPCAHDSYSRRLNGLHQKASKEANTPEALQLARTNNMYS